MCLGGGGGGAAGAFFGAFFGRSVAAEHLTAAHAVVEQAVGRRGRAELVVQVAVLTVVEQKSFHFDSCLLRTWMLYGWHAVICSTSSLVSSSCSSARACTRAGRRPTVLRWPPRRTDDVHLTLVLVGVLAAAPPSRR